MYAKIKKLFEIKENARESTHKDSITLLDKINNEIDAFIEKLRKAKQNAENDIEQYEEYLQQVATELLKTFKSHSISNVQMQSIRNIYNEVGIEFPNTNEHLEPKDMSEELSRVNDVLHDKIAKNV